MWTEAITAGGILGLVGMVFRFQQAKIGKMETGRKKDLYRPDGQTNYVPRAECSSTKEAFCDKIDEVKNLIIAMDEKREDAKDAYHEEQKNIAVQLGAIEAKLP